MTSCDADRILERNVCPNTFKHGKSPARGVLLQDAHSGGVPWRGARSSATSTMRHVTLHVRPADKRSEIKQLYASSEACCSPPAVGEGGGGLRPATRIFVHLSNLCWGGVLRSAPLGRRAGLGQAGLTCQVVCGTRGLHGKHTLLFVPRAHRVPCRGREKDVVVDVVGGLGTRREARGLWVFTEQVNAGAHRKEVTLKGSSMSYVTLYHG